MRAGGGEEVPPCWHLTLLSSNAGPFGACSSPSPSPQPPTPSLFPCPLPSPPDPPLQALHLFQEVLDQGLVWGPDITYTMIKASLDLQAAGVEDALAVAHTVMDTFERQGGWAAGWAGGWGEGGWVGGWVGGWMGGGWVGGWVDGLVGVGG